MKKKETTLCGKTVTLGYCFATEIAFSKYTGKDVSNFNGENAEDVLALILASLFSVSEGEKKDMPLTDSELMYEAKPNELIESLTAILTLRMEWYKLPQGEEPAKDEDAEKN